MSVTVYNHAEGKQVTFEGPTARESVRNAYAQAMGDYNTWDYAKYDELVIEGETVSGCKFVSCGNWTTGAHNNGRWI